MDAPRFADLARTFFSRQSRRAALGLGAAGLFGGLGLDHTPATNKKKCKQCGPCAKCQKGKCKPKKPAGTPCGEGKQCFANGQCTACDVCSTGCTHSTLQQAIDAAADGATVQLCPGTYPTNAVIDFSSDPDRALTVIGAGSGKGGTILDGQRSSHVLHVYEADLTLRRLTITRGRPISDATGGGIAASRAELVLEEVHITGNESGFEGGGVSTYQSTVTLINSHISGNSASDGGGVYNNATPLKLTAGSSVTGNTALGGASLAGGITNRLGGTVEVSKNSRVTGNSPLDCTGTDAC